MIPRHAGRAGRTVGLVLATAAAWACGARSPAPASSADGVPDADGARITAVKISGNQAISDKPIISGLATRPPTGLVSKRYTYFDPLLAAVDKERIEAYYQRQGYFSARVEDVLVRRRDDSVAVSFVVEEGEPTRITELDLAGLSDSGERPQPGELGSLVSELEVGEIFVHEEYRRAKIDLRAYLIKHGHAWATVDGTVAVDRDARTAAIRYDIDAGPLVRFGQVRVVGLEEIPRSTVAARVAWEPGQIFDPALLMRTQGRLYQLGFFSTVRVDLAESETRPALADVLIRVREADRHEIKLGVGMAVDNTLWEAHARAGYRLIGFVDPLTTLTVDARPAFTTLRGLEGEQGLGGEAMLSLQREDLVVPRLRGLARAQYRFSQLEAYAVGGPGVRLQLDRPLLSERLIASVGWQLDYLSFPSVSPAIPPELRQKLGLAESYPLGFFEQSLAYDRRDNLLDPQRGYYLQLRLEQAGAYSASSCSYLRASTEARGYVPVGERVVLAARAHYGRALAGELPITRRYISGGASSHRGFAQRRLSPMARAGGGDSAAIGGEVLLEGNLEARVDMLMIRKQWLGTAAFADYGDVVRASGDEIDLGRLHWAAGLGLRYNTLVGPVRLDVARRITRTGPGEPDGGDVWTFHLSLGEAF